VVLDKYQSLGGTWSKDRLYTGLRSNNIKGTLEFPDYPFHDGLGIKDGQHPTGEAIHAYLQEYAQHFDIDHRIRYESKVLDVTKLNSDIENGEGEGWRLTVQTPEKQYFVETEKLIIATGLSSQPQPMHVKSQDNYNAPIVNVVNMRTDAPPVLSDPSVNRVTVFGGSKFAYDGVYMFAKAGKQVDWVIRKTGHGTTWMSVPWIILGPLGKFRAELLVTRRILAWMSPCLWGGLDGSAWWRYFLHQTWLGKKFVAGFWQNMANDTLEQSGFTNHENLKPLIPDCSLFEMATSFAILNYPTDILDYVRSGQVKVHRQNLDHLSDHSVHLSDGTALQSDALIASTGWLFGPAVNFTDKTLHSSLGIPSTEYTSEQKAFWQDLDSRADAEIFSRWPQLSTLKYPPSVEEDMKENPLDEPNTSPQWPLQEEKKKVFEPQRLYRGLVPPGLAAKGDRSLAFAGLSTNLITMIRNEIAGTWIYAYLNDKLTFDPYHDVKDVYWDAALFNRYFFRRYPYGFGRRFPDFVFDSIPWNDQLLVDVGMEPKRKGEWWREYFEPYMPSDYRGLTEEWLAKQSKSKLEGKGKGKMD
jgi:hypothetical protein